MSTILNDLRPRKMSVAYRILGSMAKAADAEFDSFLRRQAAENVTSPMGFLGKTTPMRVHRPTAGGTTSKEVPRAVGTQTHRYQGRSFDSRANRKWGTGRLHDRQPGRVVPLVESRD
jgi:hypothetical protein